MKNDNMNKDIDAEKRDTPLVRLCFQDAEKAQASIARLIRARYKNKIKDFDYKSLLYGFNIWLGYNKQIKECEIEKRIAELEARIEATP